MYRVFSIAIAFILILAVWLVVTNTPFSFSEAFRTLASTQPAFDLSTVLSNLRNADWTITADWDTLNGLRDFFNAVINGFKGILILSVLIANSLVSTIGILVTLLTTAT